MKLTFFVNSARLTEMHACESRLESVVLPASRTFEKYFLLKVLRWTLDALGDKHLVVLCPTLIAICVRLIRPAGTKADHWPETN